MTTPGLRVVHDDPALILTPDRTRRLSWLWLELLRGGPVLTGCQQVNLSPDRDLIAVVFTNPACYVVWAEHLGLALTSRSSGNQTRMLSAGPVTRDGITALVHLSCGARRLSGGAA